MKFWITVLLMLVAAEVHISASIVGTYTLWVEDITDITSAIVYFDARLRSEGIKKSFIVKTTVFQTNFADFGDLQELYIAYLANGIDSYRRPTEKISCLAIKNLPKGSFFIVDELLYDDHA